MQIAVFGGSFDPPHIGHEAIAKEACRSLDIDKLLVVPTFLSPFKNDSFIDAKTRLNLMEKLFFNFNKIEICSFEVEQKRSVKTVETLEYIKKRYNTSKIYLIVGVDSFQAIESWSEYNKIKDLVEFVVVSRDNRSCEDKSVKQLNIHIDISSSSLKKSLDLEFIPKNIKSDIEKIWRKRKL